MEIRTNFQIETDPLPPFSEPGAYPVLEWEADLKRGRNFKAVRSRTGGFHEVRCRTTRVHRVAYSLLQKLVLVTCEVGK